MGNSVCFRQLNKKGTLSKEHQIIFKKLASLSKDRERGTTCCWERSGSTSHRQHSQFWDRTWNSGAVICLLCHFGVSGFYRVISSPVMMRQSRGSRDTDQSLVCLEDDFSDAWCHRVTLKASFLLGDLFLIRWVNRHQQRHRFTAGLKVCPLVSSSSLCSFREFSSSSSVSAELDVTFYKPLWVKVQHINDGCCSESWRRRYHARELKGRQRCCRRCTRVWSHSVWLHLLRRSGSLYVPLTDRNTGWAELWSGFLSHVSICWFSDASMIVICWPFNCQTKQMLTL